VESGLDRPFGCPQRRGDLRDRSIVEVMEDEDRSIVD
jgi:hypothetical protein